MRRRLNLWMTMLSILTYAVASGQIYTFTRLAGPDGGPGSIDARGGEARFTSPSAVAADAYGNIYVGGGQTIRRIDPQGNVTTLAGLARYAGVADGQGANASFGGPSDIALYPDGSLIVTDSNTIRVVTLDGTVTTLMSSWYCTHEDGPLSTAAFCYPRGIAVGASGDVYVADSGGSTIRKISNGVVSTLAGQPFQKGSTDGTGSQARFVEPTGIVVDAAGNLYVSDIAAHSVRKISASGTVTTLAGSLMAFYGFVDGEGAFARFNGPAGISIDADGNLYVSDRGNSAIRKVTPDGRVTTVAGGQKGSADGHAGSAQFLYPSDVAVDVSGALVVADTNNHAVRRISAGEVITFAGKARTRGFTDGSSAEATFSAPGSLAFDARGDVYVADDCRVRKILANGSVTTFAGGECGTLNGPVDAARFGSSMALAAHPDGSLLVADLYNYAVRRVANGVVSTFAGALGQGGSVDGSAPVARFSSLGGITVDPDATIHLTDGGSVRRITGAGVVSTIAGGWSEGSADGAARDARFKNPRGLASLGGAIYIADMFNNTIRKLENGLVSTLAGNPSYSGSTDGIGAEARFTWPFDVVSDGAGGLLVADNYAIRTVSTSGAAKAICRIRPDGVVEGTGAFARFERLGGIALGSNGNVVVSDQMQNAIYIGRPALPDVAVIDSSEGEVGVTRQLDTLSQTATMWAWSMIRRPSNSSAELPSTTVRNPTFTPDVADLYIFRLVASDGTQTSITTVKLNVKPPCVAPGVSLEGGGRMCSGSQRPITAYFTGTPPWTLEWSDGVVQYGLDESPVVRNVAPLSSEIFSAVVTNGCGSSPAPVGVAITVEQPPTALVLGSATIERGGFTAIHAELTGTAPWHLTWSDGETQTVSTSPATRVVAPTLDRSYTLAGVADAYCAGRATGGADIVVVDAAGPAIGPNLLSNADLNIDTSFWCEPNATCQWSFRDAASSPTSGSLVGSNALQEPDSFVWFGTQCIEIASFLPLAVRAEVMAPSGQEVGGNLSATAWWFGQPRCAGTAIQTATQITKSIPADGVWREFGARAGVPALAKSMFLAFAVGKHESANSFSLHIDDLFAGPVALEPLAGVLEGGTSVRIQGTGFESGAAVTFGGVAASGVYVQTPNAVVAITPAHSAGPVDVVLTNRDGRSAVAPVAFIYSLAGDVNADGLLNGADVFSLINYLFAGGPSPTGVADLNTDGAVTIADVFWLINSIYGGVW